MFVRIVTNSQVAAIAIAAIHAAVVEKCTAAYPRAARTSSSAVALSAGIE
jgi:hypothetical protein